MKVKLITLALAGLLASGIAHADYDVTALQKLFTDKKQRAQIDAARSGNYSPDAPEASKVKVSGYVTRSNGKSVVWLNDKNTLENSRVDGVNVHRASIGKNKKVTVSVDGKTVRLKPGDTWSRETGDVVDGASE